MKLMVLNFSGNVGKTVISQYLLLPRLNDAVIISVETIHSDKNKTETVTIKGNQFSSLINSTMIMNKRSIIVDVGASNAESFLSEMASIQGAHEEFDYFIIPVTPIIKQQEDTVSFIISWRQ